MSLDTQPSFKPPEFFATVKQKVEGILNHWKGGSHAQEVLQALSSVEIPEDQKSLTNQSLEVIPKNPQQSSETALNNPQQDQQEISMLTQQIHQFQTESSPVPEPSPKKLFPDRPNLYDRFHQKYEQERKTIKGAIARSTNIRRLQKEGLTKSDATEVYDSLRSRGIPPLAIKKPTPAREFYKVKPKTDKELIELLKKTPKIIDRYNSIGIIEEPGSFYFNDLSDSILKLDDNQFLERRSQIQPFIFFNKSEVSDILQRSSFSPEVNKFIDHFCKNILNGQNQQDKSFDSFKPCLRDMLTSGSLKEQNIFQYFKIFVFSDINPNQPITFPKELVDQLSDFRSSSEEKIIKYLLNIQDRQQQKYLLSTYEKMSGYYDTSLDYLFQSEYPTIDFFREYIGSKYYQGEHISLPEITLNLISNPDNPTELIENGRRRNFYHNVSNITNPKIQQICLSVDTRYKIPKYFDKKGNPTVELLINYLKDSSRLDSHQSAQIEPEYLSTLSSEDKNKLNFTRFFYDYFSNPKFDPSSYDEISYYFFSGLNSITDFIDQEGRPNSIFFKTLLSIKSPSLDDESAKYVFDSITTDFIDTFEPKDKKFWKNVSSLKNINKNILSIICYPSDNKSEYFNENGLPTDNLFTDLSKVGFVDQEFLSLNLDQQTIDSFNPKDQSFWKAILSLKNLNEKTISEIIKTKSINITFGEIFFNDKNLPTSSLFYYLISNGSLDKNFLTDNLTPEILNTYSHEDKKILSFIIDHSDIIQNQKLVDYLTNCRSEIDRYINNNELTEEFYQSYAFKDPKSFIESFNKAVWKKTFGKDVINNLLNSLPTSKLNDEKRNAFTHNQYDRTSKFFIMLSIYANKNFQLDAENIKIAAEYIKSYGLSPNLEFYKYFQLLFKHQSDPSIVLPTELVENQIDSIEKLNQEIKKTQKICFSQEPLINLSEMTPFQKNLISIITGHSTNQWTKIPLDSIISDYTFDYQSGDIKPLPNEFIAETINTSTIKTETDKKIGESQILTSLKQEILSSIDDPNNPSIEKDLISDMLNQRINSLSQDFEKVDPKKPKKQEFILKQTDVIKQKLEEISHADSTDSLLSALVSFNYGLGDDQEKLNSVLRRLVFKKVFDKHQNSPGWQESLRISLESETATVDAVDNISNLINNIIKDHALNFESKNQDGYWDESTFEVMKKYSSVFKKNLSLSTFINELDIFKKNFVITQLGTNQTVSLIPDRGLIGEMSGYMADVCYTKVYPLLKQYPGLVPYKFVSNPETEDSKFLGSTLVFQVEDADNQPVFLIRAFNIPQEQSIDIGNFFETFVDHLSSIAKKMGVKKIISAGTSGTISNYSITNNYVISKYVTGQKNVPLKNTFNFNGYDITNQCYLVRDIS